MEVGGVIIYVGFDGEDCICFFVIDIGIGIVKDKFGMIFEVFLQVDQIMICQFGGIGFGFIIVCWLVIVMGGEIVVISMFGEGMNFYFLFLFIIFLFEIGWVCWSGEQVVVFCVVVLVVGKQIEIVLVYYFGQVGFVVEMVGVDVLEYSVCGVQLVMVVFDCFFQWLRLDFEGLGVIVVVGFVDECVEMFLLLWCVDGVLIRLIFVFELDEIVSLFIEGCLFSEDICGGDQCDIFMLFFVGFKVLVVDDVEVNCEVVDVVFCCFGIVVDFVEDGWQVVDVVLKVCYDFVFMDGFMLEFDGFDVMCEICVVEMDGNCECILIVVFIVYVIGMVVDVWCEVGMDGVLYKFFMLVCLVEVISMYVSGMYVMLVEGLIEVVVVEGQFDFVVFEDLLKMVGGVFVVVDWIVGFYEVQLVDWIVELCEVVMMENVECFGCVVYVLKLMSFNVGVCVIVEIVVCFECMVCEDQVFVEIFEIDWLVEDWEIVM